MKEANVVSHPVEPDRLALEIAARVSECEFEARALRSEAYQIEVELHDLKPPISGSSTAEDVDQYQAEIARLQSKAKSLYYFAAVFENQAQCLGGDGSTEETRNALEMDRKIAILIEDLYLTHRRMRNKVDGLWSHLELSQKLVRVKGISYLLIKWRKDWVAQMETSPVDATPTEGGGGPANEEEIVSDLLKHLVL